MSNPTYHVASGIGNTLHNMMGKHGYSRAKGPHTADIVIFGGGEDISPFLYGEPKMRGVNTNFSRDMREVKLYKKLVKKQIKIGICRGAQLLNVLSGGALWQHVDNHRVSHTMLTTNSKQIRVTSTHHQMIIPTEYGLILGKAQMAMRKESAHYSRSYTEAERKATWDDTEAVYYPHNTTLCIQWHPEYNDGEQQEYFFKLLRDYPLKRLK